MNSSICLIESLYKKLDVIIRYNVDETGLTTFQKKPRRLLWREGRSKICSVSSGEEAVNTTAICCVSAAVCCVPPLLTYKRARGCDDFKDETLPGAVHAFNPESIPTTKDFS
jgi:hypothetical protein